MTILILKETGEKKDFVHDIDARVAIERGWEVYAGDVDEAAPKEDTSKDDPKTKRTTKK